MELKETKLFSKHQELKARFAPFAGFNMPIQYTSVKEEVEAVRNAVGVFDVSHMGEFFVEGDDAIKFVDYIMTNDFAGAEMNKAVYSPLCNDEGKMLDDFIAYKLEEKKVLLCVNASNIEKDWNWINTKTEGFNVSLTNNSEEFSLLALQGPKTEETLKSLGILPSGDFPYYSVAEVAYDGTNIILARTGYTGEDGVEIFAGHQVIEKLWDQLMSKGVVACGLAARDVLRLEVCYPLYGHELNEELTPLDSGLKWTVKFNKESFVGKSSLESYTPKFRLAKLSLDKGIPREGYEVLNMEGDKIGVVTSGTMSPIFGKGIAVALIEKDKFPENKEFQIQIRKNIFKANYHTKAFVTGGHK